MSTSELLFEGLFLFMMLFTLAQVIPCEARNRPQKAHGHTGGDANDKMAKTFPVCGGRFLPKGIFT